MATILTVSASPSAVSKTAQVRRLLDARLAGQGHTVHALDVRDLPPAALLAADTTHPAIAAAVDLVARADGLVVATPVYKAAYSGLLKALLDVLPQRALAGKTVLPLATGGSLAHVLVLDYALRPVLSALGATDVVQGYFLLDKSVALTGDGAELTPDTGADLLAALDRFTEVLGHRARSALVG